MKYLLFFLLGSSIIAEEPYNQITKRNAFSLLTKNTNTVSYQSVIVKPRIKLNLTGITTRGGVTNVYMFSKDLPKRYLTLTTGKYRRTNSGITLLSVEQGVAVVDNNGTRELLTFDTHKLPSVLTLPSLKSTPTVVKKKNSNKVKIAPSIPRPNIVKVPTRTPKVDPRIIEKGLEYINKIEDKEKKEYILQRLERIQSGQEQIDRKIDNNEMRRRYDERKKNK